MTDEPLVPDLDVDIPSPSGLKVTADRPYRILIVGDYAGSDAGSISGPLADAVAEVKAESFDELMSASRPTVRFTLADPHSAANAMVELNLTFESLRAFDPKNVIQQIPAARALTAVRDKLAARLLGKASPADVAAAVKTAAGGDASLAWLTESLHQKPAAAHADPDLVDQALAGIDLGDGSSGSAPKTPTGSLIAQAAGGAGIPAEETAAIRRTLREIDARVTTWLNTVLHADQVHELESAWRSLAYVVRNVEFRKGLRVSVLHTPKAQLTERFRSLLIDPVFDEGAAAPDLIAVDIAFDNTAGDLEAIDELAQHGASLPAVVLAAVGPGFLGVKHAWQVPTLPALVSMFDQWQFAKFKTLRGEPYARLLGLVFGRALLRTPHARDDAKDLEFAYQEECMSDKDLVWMNGSLVAACTAAHSVAEAGWPCGIAGFSRGRLGGFAIAHGGKKGDKKFGPTDTQMVQAKIEELGFAGLNAVVGIKDHDDALVWNGLTAARPAAPTPNGLLEVSLPYQLFAARISTLLFELKPYLADLPKEHITPFVRKHVGSWLNLDHDPTPEEANVQVQEPEDAPRGLLLAVTLTPPQNILPAGIPVVLGYRIR